MQTPLLFHERYNFSNLHLIRLSFLIVYAPDMPPSLPPLLFIRRLVQHLFLTLLFILRGVAVAVIWLGVLPWVTVWTWRMYFSMGESTWVTFRLASAVVAHRFHPVLGGLVTAQSRRLPKLLCSTRLDMTHKHHLPKTFWLESILILSG